jgi:prolipoprotein diacylglyceryltransferase
VRPRFIALLEPWLGSLAALVVPTYGVMLAIGALLCAAVIVERTRREGFARSNTLAVLAVAYAAGLAGASFVPFTQAAIAWLGGGRFAAPTGIAAYGGLVGGSLGALVALRRRGLDVVRFLDAASPAVGLGIFFARIGCFLAGCDYGKTTSSVFATTFPAGSPAFRDQVAAGLLDDDAVSSLPLHPTELYEAGAGLLLYFVLRARPRFALLVVGYALLRSAIEMFRGDVSRGAIGPLSTAQVFAIVTVAALGFWMVRHRTNPVTT